MMSRRRPPQKGSEAGFTLVELLVVIVILGVLSAVVVFAVRSAGDKGKGAAVATDERIIRTAEEVSCAQNSTYATGDELVAGQLLSRPPEIHRVTAAPLTAAGARGNCPSAPVDKQAYIIDCAPGGGTYPDCGVPLSGPPPPPLPLCSAFDATGGSGPSVPTVPSNPMGRGQSVTGPQALGAGPARFEANAGQLDPAVRFSSRSRDHTLFLTDDEMVMSLSRGRDVPPDLVRMGLVGANAHPEVEGLSRAPSSSNYMTGGDQSRWLTDVPDYQRVAYRSVYPGIDLVWHGDGGRLEYDFVVAPGADPTVIAEAFTGADRLTLDPEANLVISTPGGALTHGRPVVYQDVDGARRPVPGAYRLDGDRVGFDIGAYDPARPLVIDPVVKVDLAFATVMVSPVGGNDEGANAVATDGDGNTYLTGYTTSHTFPTQNAYQPASPDGNLFIFVTKFSPKGELLYSTYLSGSPSTLNAGYSGGYGIAVDADHNVFVTGLTQDPAFPLVPAGNKYGGAALGGAFLTELGANGNQILYSTRVANVTAGTSVAVRGSAVYIAGQVQYTDFYEKGPSLQSQNADDGTHDAFVTKFEPGAGGVLEPTYSIRLGGSGEDEAQGVVADAGGNAYVFGKTASGDFPATAGALQGANDLFVVKLGPGGARVWATFLGGGGSEGLPDVDFINGIRLLAGGIAMDRGGNVFVTGTTSSNNFPNASGTRQGATDAVLAKLSPAGT